MTDNDSTRLLSDPGLPAAGSAVNARTRRRGRGAGRNEFPRPRPSRSRPESGGRRSAGRTVLLTRLDSPLAEHIDGLHLVDLVTGETPGEDVEQILLTGPQPPGPDSGWQTRAEGVRWVHFGSAGIDDFPHDWLFGRTKFGSCFQEVTGHHRRVGARAPCYLAREAPPPAVGADPSRQPLVRPLGLARESHGRPDRLGLHRHCSDVPAQTFWAPHHGEHHYHRIARASRGRGPRAPRGRPRRVRAPGRGRAAHARDPSSARPRRLRPCPTGTQPHRRQVRVV